MILLLTMAEASSHVGSSQLASSSSYSSPEMSSGNPNNDDHLDTRDVVTAGLVDVIQPAVKEIDCRVTEVR